MGVTNEGIGVEGESVQGQKLRSLGHLWLACGELGSDCAFVIMGK